MQMIQSKKFHSTATTVTYMHLQNNQL